jgi:hypothetical protein
MPIQISLNSLFPIPSSLPRLIGGAASDFRSSVQLRFTGAGWMGRGVAVVKRLKLNRFNIVAPVDSDEVSAFIARVESAEQSGNWE